MLRSLYKIIISCNSSANITEVNSRLVSTKVGLLPPEVKNHQIIYCEVGHGHVCHALKLEEKKRQLANTSKHHHSIPLLLSQRDVWTAKASYQLYVRLMWSKPVYS